MSQPLTNTVHGTAVGEVVHWNFLALATQPQREGGREGGASGAWRAGWVTSCVRARARVWVYVYAQYVCVYVNVIFMCMHVGMLCMRMSVNICWHSLTTWPTVCDWSWQVHAQPASFTWRKLVARCAIFGVFGVFGSIRGIRGAQSLGCGNDETHFGNRFIQKHR